MTQPIIPTDKLIHEAAKEINRLRVAIRKHRDQQRDDRCKEDDDELYAALGEPFDRKPMPTREEFLASCARHYDRRWTPPHFPLAENQMTIAQLETAFREANDTVVSLRAENQLLKDKIAEVHAILLEIERRFQGQDSQGVAP